MSNNIMRETPVRDYRSPGQYVLDQYAGRQDDLSFPLWMNLGYWKQAATYAEACQALADLVGSSAQLAPGDCVLDAGCGFGHPALHWLTAFRPSRIVGVNIDETQCRIARARADKHGASDRLAFMMASATRLPIPNASFDKVIALESAFYFDTREAFLHEAFRVLRPGGRIVLADMLPTLEWQTTPRNRQVRWYSMKPEENVYALPEYLSRMRSAGFIDVVGRSIRQYVFPHMAKIVRAIRDDHRFVGDIHVEVLPEEMATCSGAELWQDDLGLGDFAIIEGVRPAERTGHG